MADSRLRSESPSPASPDIFVKHVSLAGLAPSEIARVAIEGEVLSRIEHPNIVRIHHVELARGTSRLSLHLEKVSGRPLDEYLRGLPAVAAERTLEQILRAVEVLHAHGVSHGDLRPANILCTGESPDAGVKLVDFDVARAIDSNRDPIDFDRLIWSDLVQLRGTLSAAAPDELRPTLQARLESWARRHLQHIGLISSAGENLPGRGVPRLAGRRDLLAAVDRLIVQARRFRKSQLRVLFVGPKGSGKSRILREVRALGARHFMESRGLDQASFPDKAPCLYVVDEADDETVLQLRRMQKGLSGLIVAAVDPFVLGARALRELSSWAEGAKVFPLRDLRNSELTFALQDLPAQPWNTVDFENVHRTSFGNPGASQLVLARIPIAQLRLAEPEQNLARAVAEDTQWKTYVDRLGRAVAASEKLPRIAASLLGDRGSSIVWKLLSRPRGPLGAIAPVHFFPSVGRFLFAGLPRSEWKRRRESLLARVRRRPQVLGGQRSLILVSLFAGSEDWARAFRYAHLGAQSALRQAHFDMAWRIAAPCLLGPASERKMPVLYDALQAAWKTGRCSAGLEIAQELAKGAPHPRLDLFIGRFCRDLGLFEDARKALLQGLQRVQGEVALRSEILADLAYVLQLLHRPEEARKAAESAISGLPEKESPSAAANAALSLSTYYFNFSDPLSALRILSFALRRARGGIDRLARARLLHNVALCHFRIGQLSLARRFALRASALFRNAGDPSRAAHASLILGQVKRDAGSLSTSARILLSSMRTLSGQGAVTIEISAGLGLAETYLAAGRFARADALLSRLSDRAMDLKEPQRSAAALALKSWALDRLGFFRDADLALKKAGELARTSRREDVLAWVCRSEGQIRQDRNDLEGAAAAFARAGEHARQAGHAPLAVELDLRRALALALMPASPTSSREIQRLLEGGLRAESDRLRSAARILQRPFLKRRESGFESYVRRVVGCLPWYEWKLAALRVLVTSGCESVVSLPVVLSAHAEAIESGDVVGQLEMLRAASDLELLGGLPRRSADYAQRGLELILEIPQMKKHRKQLESRVLQARPDAPSSAPDSLRVLDQILATTPGSPRQLIDRVLDAAVEILHADAAYLLLYSRSERFTIPHSRAAGSKPVTRAHLTVSRTVAAEVRRSGRPVCIPDTMADPRAASIGSLRARGILSVLAVPFTAPGYTMAVLMLESRTKAGLFDPRQIAELDGFAGKIAVALRISRGASSGRIEDPGAGGAPPQTPKGAGRELLTTPVPELEFGLMVGESEAMKLIFDQIRKVGPTDLCILISGDSGTGKELVARALHQEGPRRKGPYIAVNCGAITPSLLESELFGHAAGSFTGALAERIGLFESAAGGTIFLDEIAETPLTFQVALLRVLEQKQIRRVGDSRDRSVDVRILAATNADIRRRIAEGHFRQDLFYRLNSCPLFLPPLRDRLEDLPLLVTHFLSRVLEKKRLAPRPLDPDVLDVLRTYPWPGNVRELENVLEQALALAADRVTAAQVMGIIGTAQMEPGSTITRAHTLKLKGVLKSAERAALLEALRLSPTKTEAAKLLGIDRAYFYDLLKKHGLQTPAR